MDIIEHGIWYEQVVNSEDSRAYELYLGFINLVDKNFRTLHSSEDYAKMMSTSLSTLTRCVSSVAGKTPFKVINERIIIEAKRMLFEKTSMRIKEIAFELGFTDNSNFVKFFKRNTGMSPVEFRESH